MARRHPAIAQLVALVDEAFNRAAWHGPTLQGAVRGVTARQAAWRPARGRHNIREIVLHAAFWKHMVRRRLAGHRRAAFPLAGDNWIAVDPSRTWDDDRRLLASEHRQLRAVVQAYPARALGKSIDAKRQTAAYSIRGIAAHDLYHAGQIQLLKRLQR
jgi:DinB superfamily